MKFQIISRKQLQPAIWDGGKTFEYFIFPESSPYRLRNFDFRISSATIAKVPSQFTRFEGYTRFLVMLDNQLKIERNGIPEQYSEGEVFSFDSNDQIQSFSLGSDFNLMVKKSISPVSVKWVNNFLRFDCKIACFFSPKPATVVVHNQSFILKEGDCLIASSAKQTHNEFQVFGAAVLAAWF